MAAGDYTQTTCPHCGYCPHCGRSAAPWYPTVPYYARPWQPYTGPTWIAGPTTLWSGGNTVATGNVSSLASMVERTGDHTV
jgi:hypothetical protein